MARIAGGALAAAVTKAGGLGFVGGGYGDLAWIGTQLAIAGTARVGIGLITWRLDEEPDLLASALALAPRALWLSYGDPTPYIDRIRTAGAVAVCQVLAVDDARHAVAAGAQVIVIQGSEAGGHGRAGRGLLTLIPAVVDAVGPVPVVAAGGIGDGRQLAACWALGAAGIVLGTRLYATPEALDADHAKQRLVDAGGDDTLHTTVFDLLRGPTWPPGYTGRAIANHSTDTWHGREHDLSAVLPAERERYQTAADAGDLDARVLWAGEGVDLIHDVIPAAEIVAHIHDDALAGRR